MLDRFNTRAALVALLLLAAPAFAAEWPQSDIPRDPSINFSTLPNGMRYAIRRNATPTGEVSVRFHIAAGAIQEAEDQRGLAHFLEHMAFHGSTNVKDGEYTRMLERIGLRFGSDTNASTTQEETIYQFDLPRSDDASVDTALTLSREIASNLTIAPDAAKTESGVVLSELQLRELPSFKALQARLEFLLKDKRAIQLPNGEASVIARGSVLAMRAYYHAYYRPERATLIVVGDIDPARIEARIRQIFGDWKGQGRAIADPPLNIPLGRGLEVSSFTAKGVANSISLTWTAAPEKRPGDTVAERAGLIEALAMQVLNRRYQEESVTPERPFTRAGVSRGQSYHAVRMASLSVGYRPGQWKTALVTAERMRRAILQSGATQAELDRAIREMRSGFEQHAASAATRPSRAIANSIIRDMGENEVSTSDERNLAAFEAYVKGLTLDEVNRALREVFTGGGPLIFAGGENEFEGGEAAIRSAYLEAQKDEGTLAAREQGAAKPWTYTNFGPRGTVAARQEVADVGATFVRFANGVRLTVRPSRLRANQIQVSVKVGDGRLGMSRDRLSATWAAGVVVSGGLKDMTSTEISRALSGRQYGIDFGVSEDGFTFSGGTTPADVDLQMQVLAAFVTTPAFRADAFERYRTAYLERLRNSGISPNATMSLKLPEILHAGDKRWASAMQADVESAKPEELSALLLPAFEKGAIDVIIVGDITVDRAIAVTAATFGAFAPRTTARLATSAANSTRFPDGAALQRLITSDQKGQEIVTTAWPTHGRFPDLKSTVTLSMLAAIMQERLFDRMRGLGTGYVAQVGSTSSKVFDYGYIQALAQLEPVSAQKFHEELGKIIADLQAGRLTEDDLTRARVPTLEQLRKSRETNEYWLSVLDDTQQNPAKLDLARKYESTLREIAAADIVAAARKYLTDARAIKVSVGPPAS
ncbi:MAG TPA: insulinase family protein [Rhizomicrobium sp.]|nr:insulinase family protein [Rhizomicrobium sp.]